MTEVTEYHFGISLASLLPHTIRYTPYLNGSADDIATWLRISEFEFFQTLPLRGITGLEWFCQPEWSWYREDAWNAVDILEQALRHEHGASGEPSNWRDWAAFPDTRTVNEVFARLAGRHVSHDFNDDPDRLVEVKPGHELSASEMALVAERGGYELCLDTEHAIEDRRNGTGSPFGHTVNDRIAAVDEYAHLVRLVHLKDIDGPGRRIAERLANSPRRKSRIDVCVEFIPDPWMTADEAIARARRYLKSARRIFQTA